MNTPPQGEAPQNHPRYPLRLYGINRKKKRRERCQNRNIVRNIRKKERRKRHKTPNRARGND
jgi:hypothetical protein